MIQERYLLINQIEIVKKKNQLSFSKCLESSFAQKEFHSNTFNASISFDIFESTILA